MQQPDSDAHSLKYGLRLKGAANTGNLTDNPIPWRSLIATEFENRAEILLASDGIRSETL
jgi:hypothetical protein